MRAIALLLPVAPLALAACGGASRSAGRPQLKIVPVKYVRQAAQKTAAAPSEHMTMSGTGSKDGQTFTVSGNGDAENGQQLLEMHADFSTAGSAVHLDLIGAGPTIYLSSPQFAGQIPGGKTWMKLDLEKAAAAVSSTLTQSPSQALSLFKHAVHSVDLGAGTVDGVAATRYRVRIDDSRLPRKLRGSSHGMQETTDVWVGKSDGYVHRMQLADGTLSVTMDFSNFGEAVRVRIPPASDTFDATNLALGQLGG